MVDAEMPDDSNGDVLRRLLAAGDDLSLPRDLHFSITFPTETAARHFADMISSDFEKIEYEKSEGDARLTWEVTATRFMVPAHQAIGAMESFLAERAEPVGGRNDGWGCFSVKSP